MVRDMGPASFFLCSIVNIYLKACVFLIDDLEYQLCDILNIYFIVSSFLDFIMFSQFVYPQNSIILSSLLSIGKNLTFHLNIQTSHKIAYNILLGFLVFRTINSAIFIFIPDISYSGFSFYLSVSSKAQQFCKSFQRIS